MHSSDHDFRSRLSAARLPAMPQILLELMEHCQADETGMAQLAELISKDAGICAKILGVAHSSAYHHRGPQVSIEQALLTIGTDMVKTLLISESVFQIFDNFSQTNGTDLRAFWKHSLAAAASARMIASRIGYPHVEEAYLAGLLHDVGRLALLATAPKEYGFNFLAQDDEVLCAVEQRTLQLTHAEAGAWLIERWNLDSFLADSVLYHHEPASRLTNAHPLIRIVFVAHQLCGPAPDDAALESSAALCGIAPADIADIRTQANEQVVKSAEYLGIDLADIDKAPVPAAQVPPVAQDPARERLTEKVRNLVLATEAGRSFSKQPGEPALLESIMRSARLLFDFADAALLLVDDDARELRGAPAGSHRQRLAEFSIPLGSGTPIADAALQRRPAFISREAAPLGVHEEQLLRILGTECIACLPITAGERCRAVIVSGVASWQLAELKQREGFLQAFAAQAGAAMKALASDSDEASRATANVEEKFREASRRVAHEVNNPLAIIKNYLSVLDRKLARQETVNGEISILNEEIDRVGQIINGLADPQPAASEGTVEINRAIDDMVRLFRDTEYVPPSVRILASTLDQPCEIDGDADALKQVLLNLVKNAVEALPGGGEIEIANNGYMNRDGRLYLELLVADTGPGIPVEVMARLFSPVRTSKGEGHRGLGLSIVHGLVKGMQGLISCRSNSQGTTFEILLPARMHTEQATAARPHAHPA